MKILNKIFKKSVAVFLGLNIFVSSGSAWNPWVKFGSTGVRFGGDGTTVNSDSTIITIHSAVFKVNGRFVPTSIMRLTNSTTRFFSIIYNLTFYVDMQNGQIVNCGIGPLVQIPQQQIIRIIPIQPQPQQLFVQAQDLSAFKPVPSRCLTLDSDNILTFDDNILTFSDSDSETSKKKHIQEKKPKKTKHKTAEHYKDSYCDHCKKVTMSYAGTKKENGKIRHIPRCDECENEKKRTYNWKAKCNSVKCDGKVTDHYKLNNQIKCCECKNATFTFNTPKELHDEIDSKNLVYICKEHGDLTKEDLYINNSGFSCKKCKAE